MATSWLEIQRFLVFTLFLVLECCAEWNTNDYLKREHSLTKPYLGSGMTPQFWDFTGSTIFTGQYVRLTPDEPSKQGTLWNNHGVEIRNWELQVHFKVHGSGKDHLHGDGFAIWYTRHKLEPGNIFGNRDKFDGLAIFLDTYSNHNGPHNHAHPYISAMVNNGTLSYDHDSDGTHTELAGCEAKFRKVDHETYIAIRYENDELTVSTDIEGKSGWKECFKSKGVLLPTGYYIGFSAATGDLSDNHDIIGVKLYALTEDEHPDNPLLGKVDRSKVVPSASIFTPPRDHVDGGKPQGMSGLKIFMIILLALLGIAVCVVVAIMFVQRNQETNRKRFY